MRTSLIRAGVALSVACFASTMAACTMNDTTGVQVISHGTCGSLTGSFVATDVNATGVANTTLTDNVLGNGGTFGLDFTGGNFTSTFTSTLDGQPLTQSNTFTTTTRGITLGNQPLFTGLVSGNQVFSCFLSGDTLTLTGNNVDFNFPGMTTTQPAAVTITLVRPTA